MIQRFTALLMFVIALVNVLNIGAAEQILTPEIPLTVTSLNAPSSDLGQTFLASENRQSDDDNGCHHEDANCHQCHLGHCQYLIATAATSIPRPNGLLRREWIEYSYINIHLPSLERPPRVSIHV